MTPSRKRQKPTPADGDTRVVVVEDRCDSPPANQEALTELPWGSIYESFSSSDSESESVVVVDDDSILNTPPHYYDDVDEDAIASSPAHEKENDDNFTYSPASPPPPPLTQSTHEDKTIPILYVFPDETVVVKADGEHIRIPDKNTKTHLIVITQSTSTEDLQSSTIEDPKR